MPIRNLDYKPARLSIEVMNEVEHAYREGAVEKEPWTVSFIEAIPAGAVFWDIGANTGPYSLIAAYRNLTTIAIEPGFNNYAALCRNLAMNGLLDRCICLCAALGEQSHFDWLHYQDTRQGAAHHVLGGARKQFFHKQLVAVWSWDELAARIPLPPDRPQYAKVDVDGGEMAVLRGASKALQRLTGIMVEMHDGTDPTDDTPTDQKAITKCLQKAGFRLVATYDQRAGGKIPGIVYGRFERG